MSKYNIEPCPDEFPLTKGFTIGIVRRVFDVTNCVTCHSESVQLLPSQLSIQDALLSVHATRVTLVTRIVKSIIISDVKIP